MTLLHKVYLLYTVCSRNEIKPIFLDVSLNEAHLSPQIYNSLKTAHYVPVVFKSCNIILVSHHIPRTEICRILPSVRTELRNMIEGGRAASARYVSHLLMLFNMLKTVNNCTPASWENHSIP